MNNQQDLLDFESSFRLMNRKRGINGVSSIADGYIRFKNGSFIQYVDGHEFVPEINAKDINGYKQVLVGDTVSDEMLLRIDAWVSDQNSYEVNNDPNNDDGFALFLSGQDSERTQEEPVNGE